MAAASILCGGSSCCHGDFLIVSADSASPRLHLRHGVSPRRRFCRSAGSLLAIAARDPPADKPPPSAAKLPQSFPLDSRTASSSPFSSSSSNSSSSASSSSSSKTSSNSSNSSNESHQVLVASAAPSPDMQTSEEQEPDVDRVINAMIVVFAGAFAITKILTVDRDYWHGWTVFEILKYAPLHNWSAYEDALQSNPLLAKMMISGIVYSIGDWFAQCYEGKPLLDISRERIFRSGLVGFCLHGSLSHFYYYLCEFLFPFKDWWGVPIKVAFDQTIWSGFWNSVYFVTLGILRLESPQSIASELKATFWPMLSAGWKLWPFAHIITYGVIPVEQRLLWVDCVELVWVTILSMYSNEKAEARSLGETSSNSKDALVVERRTYKEEK